MAATVLQWNSRGLRCNRKDFDILMGEHRPGVVCLRETKLGHPPPLSHYQCANYDCYYKSLRGNPDQLPCGGVSIYIKKGLYHKSVRIDSHLQAVAVRVALGGAPVAILSTSQATTTSPSEICRIWSGTLEARYLSWVTSIDTTLCGAAMMLTLGVESLRDSPINTICVFSMVGPAHVWGLGPNVWTDQPLQ